VLEKASTAIGVVHGVVGVHAYQVELIGKAAHTGTTPIPHRKDALLGAARIIEGVRQLALRNEPHGRASVGYINVSPNARSVVADKVVLTADCRHTDEAKLDSMRAELLELFQRAARDEDLHVSVHNYWSVAPTHFSPMCIDVVQRAAQSMGYSHDVIYSGAGHDAVHLSRIAPAAMIFIPCKDGVSHHEAESITPEQAAEGANVLLHSLLELSNSP
jgi:N-carbamoyl-L-amino-acid hydrolase